MKVSFKYNEELKNYVKSVGGKWDPDAKAWDIPDEAYDDVRYKAMDLGVDLSTYVGRKREDASAPARSPAPTPSQVPENAQRKRTGTPSTGRQGTIFLGRSKDGRYMIMRINLVAFAEDVQAVLDGTKRGAKFRVMMPRPRQPQ